MGNSWKEVRKTLQINAKLPDAQLLAGNLLLKAGRGKDALGYFEEYLKLEPKGEFAEQTQTLVKKIRKSLAEESKNKLISKDISVEFLDKIYTKPIEYILSFNRFTL